MKKILFVCHGNICRSPMAEAILKAKARKNGKSIIVESAGFEPYHLGDSPDERAIETLAKHNISVGDKKARLFSREDFHNFDKIFFMDESNRMNLEMTSRNDDELKNCDYLMNTVYKGKNISVPDPYYDGVEGFENVYKMLDRACDEIINNITKNEL